MQHIPCSDYTLIGQLLHAALESNQKIHNSIIAATEVGSINIYYYKDTYILECDTNGDNDCNDYYFFKTVEENQLYDTLVKLGYLIGTTDVNQIKEYYHSTLDFLKKSYVPA